MVRCTILTDNSVRKSKMLGEHGLSLWIEAHGQKILFDTGQTWVFTHNAKLMGIDVEKPDHVVLSHGHYDHTGGMPHFPRMNPESRLYIHPDFFARKFRKLNDKGETKYVGVGWKPDNSGFPQKNIVYNREPLAIKDGILLSGEIPRIVDFEEEPKGFLVEDAEGNLQKDVIKDEQMLIVEDTEGICIFLGCSHPGVANCLQYALKLFPGKKVLGLVGGMHLEKVPASRIDKTIQCFVKKNVQKVVPLHCTGFEATSRINQELGASSLVCSVGDILVFGG